MSKISVAFAVNEGYVKHLLIAVYSLLKNNFGNELDLYVLQKDFSDKSRKQLRKLGSRFKHGSITLVDMEDKMDLFKNISLLIDYISIETYFRFVLADLFPELDKILYLDSDIIVPGNLAKLWNTEIDDYYAAGVEDPHIIDEDHKKVVNFTNDDLYVNAGVLLLNLRKIREEGIVKKLFANLHNNPGVRYQDQDILNITFKHRVKRLDIVNNFMWGYQQAGRDRYDDAVVLHYNGPVKPWQSYGLNNRPFWFYIYDEYVDDYSRDINDEPDERTEKFGLFTYTTENVGDDIQSIAARQFLPKIDYYIDRDFIDSQNYKDATNVKLIMNGWYTHQPQNWPPKTAKIDPLLVAMYFSSEHSERVKKAILSVASREFFNKHGKVGVRDLTTERFFKTHEVDSYFTGCLTLTITKSPKINKQNFILAVDVPEDTLAVMKQQTKRRIITVTPEIITYDMSPAERLKIAERFLFLVQSAHSVVTTRLHSALPSLAVETPVLFMLKTGHRETDRFEGLIELTNSLSQQEYNKDPSKYNIDQPPKNPTTYLRLRMELIEKAKKHTGFMNENGFLMSELPFDVNDHDFIQRFFNALHEAYLYQNLRGILTNRSVYVSTEIEEYVKHLKVVETEYANLKHHYDELNGKYSKIVKYPRLIRNSVRRFKGEDSNE